jgi:hypothetical protein
MAYVAFTEDQFMALDDFLTELADGGQATLVPKSVTENGTYDPADDDADGYSSVTVAVPSPVVTVEPLSVTQNGTYNPPTGVNGYAPVTVNVSGGGGGGTIKMGVLRPDAELWQRFTYDRWIVADEGVTIPAYSTSSQNLKASETIATITDVDTDEYSYYVLLRGLTIPKYVSGTADGAGKPVYHAFTCNYELSVNNSQTIAPTGIPYSGKYVFTVNNYAAINLYYSSATECVVAVGSNGNYGCYQQGGSASLSDTQIKLTSPRLSVRGETNLFKQGYWDALEDIRCQYVFEVYRAPNGGEYFDGFNVNSHLTHTLSCAKSASGNLT